MGEERVAGFDGARASVPMMTAVRSTWITSSVLGVREHGHYERYSAALDPKFRDAILGAVAGSWIEMDAFAAHYAACDALGLPEYEQVEMGVRTNRQIHGTMIDLSRRLAREAGVTPWALLELAPKLFGRVSRGGGVVVFALGPKEARVELLGYPVARYRYARFTMRGAVGSIARLFGHTVYVHDVRSLCTPTSLGYRVQWA